MNQLVNDFIESLTTEERIIFGARNQSPEKAESLKSLAARMGANENSTYGIFIKVFKKSVAYMPDVKDRDLAAELCRQQDEHNINEPKVEVVVKKTAPKNQEIIKEPEIKKPTVKPVFKIYEIHSTMDFALL